MIKCLHDAPDCHLCFHAILQPQPPRRMGRPSAWRGVPLKSQRARSLAFVAGTVVTMLLWQRRGDEGLVPVRYNPNRLHKETSVYQVKSPVGHVDWLAQASLFAKVTADPPPPEVERCLAPYLRRSVTGGLVRGRAQDDRFFKVTPVDRPTCLCWAPWLREWRVRIVCRVLNV